MSRFPSRARRWIRPAVLAYALALFFWVGYEDRSPGYVTALGAGASALVVAHAALDAWGGAWRALPAHRRLAWLGLGGLTAGLLVAPLTAALMAVKISLHSHDAPEFTLEELVGTLARTPVWAGAGLLTGLGAGLIHLAFRRPPPPEEIDLAH